MKNMRKNYKWKILAPILLLAVLGFSFWYGGNAPGLRGWSVSKGTVSAPAKAEPSAAGREETKSGAGASESSASAAPVPDINTAKPGEESALKAAAPDSGKGRPLTADGKLETARALSGGESSEGVEKGSEEYSKSQGMEINPSTGKDKYFTDPVPSGKPVPVEPQNAVITDEVHTCTLSVRCDTILRNMSWLDKNKWELVPRDGVIFAAKTVTFYKGESVFNVLQREMKKAKIHMEFRNTPMYNSVYIEGINNLYEFDCGELSGWMYRVNGWFPNYGCSRYQLKEGDVVEWVYTCNLGIDVGGYYAVGS